VYKPALRSAATKGVLFACAIVVVGCTNGNASGDVSASPPASPPRSYALGSTIDSASLKRLDIDVDPSGATLPAGSGNATAGLVVYASKCASCHGAKGEGRAAGPGVAAAPKIVGREPREGFPFGRDPRFVKTVGNYWPYATTVYDYVHRAMPITAPGTLTPDQTYAVVAWLLAENEIIPRDAEMNARTLPAVKMPAAGRFVTDDRTGKTVK
jgi:S-disulfanyl-L-cysteine oxidoreductase SoxD